MTETKTKEAPKKLTEKQVFALLSKQDVSAKVETKGRLKYLSWANAVGILRQNVEHASWHFREWDEIVIDGNGIPHKTGRSFPWLPVQGVGVFVACTLEVDGNSYPEVTLYCMDNRNRTVQNPDAALINKTQWRCLVKAIAEATGLGLNLYAGEDLPFGADEQQPPRQAPRRQQPPRQPAQQQAPATDYRKKFAELVQATAKQTGESVEQVKKDLTANIRSKDPKEAFNQACSAAVAFVTAAKQATQNQPA